jgi:hypothetical protein
MSTIIEARRSGRSVRSPRKVSAVGYWTALTVVVAGVMLAVLWGVNSADRATESAQGISPVLGALSLILVSMVIAATIVFVTLLRRTQGVK